LISRKNRILAWLSCPVLVAGLAFVASDSWLPFLGTFLVDTESLKLTPPTADAAVVLAGDSYGLRIAKGGDLVKIGVVPVALISGPMSHYERSESDLAIEWAERHGYNRNMFEGLPNNSTSTENEASSLLQEIRRRGHKKILVVTSNYHTRRAGKIWRRHTAGSGIEVHMVAAPDRDFVPERWWHDREGRKKLFFEWLKTLTGPIGL
jgi:uncharacterized SAM-binding protein YcdF (DUF218 family)